MACVTVKNYITITNWDTKISSRIFLPTTNAQGYKFHKRVSFLLSTGEGGCFPACITAVADLRGARGMHAPLGIQILSISCSFWENLAKSYVGALGSWRPLLGEILDPPLHWSHDQKGDLHFWWGDG